MHVNEQTSPFDDGPLYDLMCEGLDYGVDFYVGQVRASGGPVLEIACGTGRITLPCLQTGARVDGLDLYQPMLDHLRAKAAKLGYAPRLMQGDMGCFELPDRYALIMITFNAFIHNMTAEAQLSCLRCCREHLAEGGVLVFDTFFPGIEYLSIPTGTRVLEGEIRHPTTGLTSRMYDTRSFDRVNQIQHSINEFEHLDGRGEITRVDRAEFATRYLFKNEVELLLRLAGYRRWEVAGDFDLRPIENETDMMLVRAWK